MSAMVPDDAPKPRLCHVKKTPTFNGYGFNLHAEKGKAGQYVGKVDEGSPAVSAGLKEGDKIVEVNGTNVGNENHQQVVQRITAVPNETKLLVVDAATEKYYKDKKIIIRGDMPNVAYIDSEGSSNDAPSSTVPEDAPKARLCHMKIWPDFQGYGFNLHAEKGKPGQFVGNVDDGSPASTAGLKKGDRIVEVNGESVETDTHAQVVDRIKAVSGQTKLLVVDSETDQYYKSRNVAINSNMQNLSVLESPDSKAAADANDVNSSSNESVGKTEEVAAPVVAAATPPPPAEDGNRLCHLVMKPDFAGYGFNLHAEKGKAGQYVIKVEDGSPSQAAGLRVGDKVLEVNGTDVRQEQHAEVVAKIKEIQGEVKLLVCNDEPAPPPVEATGVEEETKQETPVAVEAIVVTNSEPKEERLTARLCHLKIWPDFQGYGFNLHAEKGKPGQFVGKVDDGSPAQHAGVEEADRIIAVNGQDIGSSNHSETVQKVKSVPNETKLLVISKDQEKLCLEKGIEIVSANFDVENHECPDSNPGHVNGTVTQAEVNHEPAENGTSPAAEKEEIQQENDKNAEVAPVIAQEDDHKEAEEEPDSPKDDHKEAEVKTDSPKGSEKDDESVTGTYEVNGADEGALAAQAIEDSIREAEDEESDDLAYNHRESPRSETPPPIETPVYEPEPELEAEPEPKPEPELEPEPVSVTPEPEPEPVKPEPVVEANASSPPPPAEPAPKAASDPLGFPSSVAEARARLSKKKKQTDPKHASLNMKEKYELFQKL